MRKMHLSAGAVVLLTSGALVAGHDAAQLQKADLAVHSTYYFFDEARPLRLDGGRIAVLRSGDGLEPIGELQARPFGIPGWSLVSTDGERQLGGMLDLVEEVERLPGATFVSPVFIGLDGGPVIPTDRILVRFHDWVGKHRAEAILRETLGAVVLQPDDVGVRSMSADFGGAPLGFQIQTSGRDGFETLALANELAQMEETVYAEPDMLFTGSSMLIPNDTFWTNQWGLHNTGQSGGVADQDMDIPEAWDITTGDNSIIVAILDTGVDTTHPDLNLRLPGVDTTTDVGTGEAINACDNHGSPVAGCISAIINNNLGVVGAAPTCRTASARPFISNLACDGSWNSASSWTVNALTWAQGIGARVTNNSNGYGFTSSAIADAYNTLRNNGIVHFGSAGNNSGPSPTYPASLPTVMAVHALNRTGALASFSNTGGDISAPGEVIGSTDRVGAAGYVSTDYVNISGTSFASPYTAAVAALVLSVDPSLTAPEVEQLLKDTAVDLGASGFDATFGAGFVNAFNAVTAAGASCPADFDGSGFVDATDLALLLGGWGSGGLDLNNDGVVDATDLALLLGGWGPC